MLWLRSMWCSLAQVANEQFDNELYQRFVGFSDRVVVVHGATGIMCVHMAIGIMLVHVAHVVTHLVLAHIVAHAIAHLVVVVFVAVHTLLIELVVAVLFFSLVFCRGILAVIVVHCRRSDFCGG